LAESFELSAIDISSIALFLLGLGRIGHRTFVNLSLTKSVHGSAGLEGQAMMRVRLKADGRLVEVLADGAERLLPPPLPPGVIAEPMLPESRAARSGAPDASYARRVRSQTRLTQAEFAARIGVPIETVRNWEQGKRTPRGPARALLKLLDHAPDVAFSVLAPNR
jgi:putative transcriptional regulator